MALQQGLGVKQLLVHLRHGVLQVADGFRRADAGDHVFAGRIGEVFTEENVLPGGWIAGEGNAGARGLAEVTKHHGLDAYGGAHMFVDIVHFAVNNRPGRVPGQEDRLDGVPELFMGVLGKLDELLEFRNYRLPVFGGHLGIELFAIAVLVRLNDLFELLVFGFQDHVGIHLDEAPVGVVGKAGIAGLFCEPFGDGVIHHAGHRYRCARADREQKGIFRVTEARTHVFLDQLQRHPVLGLELVRQPIAALEEFAAGGGGNDESIGHRQAHAGHLAEICSLAAQQLPVILAALVEQVYALRHCLSWGG